jgi:hypothetical protein
MTRPAARLFALLAILLAPPALAQRMSDTPADRTEPGVTLRVWQVAEQPERIPQLAENQTPNLDERRDAIDFTQGDFGGLPATLVTAVLGELVVPTAGTYRFRLTSDDGARLFIGDVDNRDGGLRGYQIEIDPTDRAYSAGIYDEQRRGWLAPLHTAPDARRAFRPGDWNTVRVLAHGPVIRTWINGVPAAEILDAADASGHIGFQVHDVGTLEESLRVEFRNARIRELTPAR